MNLVLSNEDLHVPLLWISTSLPQVWIVFRVLNDIYGGKGEGYLTEAPKSEPLLDHRCVKLRRGERTLYICTIISHPLIYLEIIFIFGRLIYLIQHTATVGRRWHTNNPYLHVYHGIHHYDRISIRTYIGVCVSTAQSETHLSDCHPSRCKIDYRRMQTSAWSNLTHCRVSMILSTSVELFVRSRYATRKGSSSFFAEFLWDSTGGGSWKAQGGRGTFCIWCDEIFLVFCHRWYGGGGSLLAAKNGGLCLVSAFDTPGMSSHEKGTFRLPISPNQRIETKLLVDRLLLGGSLQREAVE